MEAKGVTPIPAPTNTATSYWKTSSLTVPKGPSTLILGNHNLLLGAIKSEDPFKDVNNDWCEDPLPRLSGEPFKLGRLAVGVRIVPLLKKLCTLVRMILIHVLFCLIPDKSTCLRTGWDLAKNFSPDEIGWREWKQGIHLWPVGFCYIVQS